MAVLSTRGRGALLLLLMLVGLGAAAGAMSPAEVSAVRASKARQAAGAAARGGGLLSPHPPAAAVHPPTRFTKAAAAAPHAPAPAAGTRAGMERAVERAYKHRGRDGAARAAAARRDRSEEAEDAFLARESPGAVHDCGIYGNDCNMRGAGPDEGDRGTFMSGARTEELSMLPDGGFLRPAAPMVLGQGPAGGTYARAAHGRYAEARLGRQPRRAFGGEHALASELYREAVEAAHSRATPASAAVRQEAIRRDVARAMARGPAANLQEATAAAAAPTPLAVADPPRGGSVQSAVAGSVRMAVPQVAGSERPPAESAVHMAAAAAAAVRAETIGAEVPRGGGGRAPALAIAFPPVNPNLRKPAPHAAATPPRTLPLPVQDHHTGAVTAVGGEDGAYDHAAVVPHGGEDGAHVPRTRKFEGGEDGAYVGHIPKAGAPGEVHEASEEGALYVDWWSLLFWIPFVAVLIAILVCCIGCCVRAHSSEGEGEFADRYSEEVKETFARAHNTVTGVYQEGRDLIVGAVGGSQGAVEAEGEAAKAEGGEEKKDKSFFQALGDMGTGALNSARGMVGGGQGGTEEEKTKLKSTPKAAYV